MIYLVPIEPLEERYSKQWLGWFLKHLEQPVFVVEGKTLTDTIEDGSFLDVVGTNFYKASQLQTIMSLIYEGVVTEDDTFLFLDIWFPGLEMLEYVRRGLGINFKITGCLHAGTYDSHDYLCRMRMQSFGMHLENSWFQFIDLVFVATEFHKTLLHRKREIFPNRVKVTGFPIYMPSVDPVEKDDLVVFPHRLDEEKQPWLFDTLAQTLRGTGWSFIKTAEVWDGNKQDYYKLLAKAKIAVSFARQETWGIAMQEALFLGCIPVVPDKLSYAEMYQSQYLYPEGAHNATQLVEHYMSYDPKDFSRQQNYLLSLGEQAIPNIEEEIWKLHKTK